MTAEPTYKCLLCGVDHLVINGRVEHTIFSRSPTADVMRDAARYRALHPYLRACMEYDAQLGHVLRLGPRTIPTGEKESGWTGVLIDQAADYAVAIKSGRLPDGAA